MPKTLKDTTAAVVTLLAILTVGAVDRPTPSFAQGRVGRLGGILRRRARRQPAKNVETVRIAGLEVAVWRPSTAEPAPLIVFSHGFTGCNTQSTFLMEALANAGYLVVAPNHQDNRCGRLPGLSRAEEPFRKPEAWNNTTYDDRRRDIERLVDALRDDRSWNINWSQVALAGHSLGGYTVLGLAGGWPDWRLGSIRAVLALSPYCEPFAVKGALGGIQVPVMYEGGTRDRGITPSVKKAGGCFDKTSSPAIFVEFNGVGHFGFSDLADQGHDLIVRYSLAFLDKYVRGIPGANPVARVNGVTDLKTK